MKKRMFLLTLVCAMIIISTCTSFASDNTNYEEITKSTKIDEENPICVNESDIIILDNEDMLGSELTNESTEINNRSVNEYGYRKVNVKETEAWSDYAEISDYLKTDSKGGAITSNTTKTFKTDVTGSILGLNITVGGLVSSSKGYTLNVGPYQNVCMGYRVKYNVESGTRETYDKLNGKTISSNSYKVKTPKYGEYSLIISSKK